MWIWQLQAQWNESEGYSERHCCCYTDEQFYSWRKLWKEVTCKELSVSPGEPPTRQVPRADPEPIYPSLVDICLGVSSLWRRLCLTLNSSFIKASANSTHGSDWHSTTEAEEGVGSGGGLSAWCVHPWVACQLRATEQGQETQGGVRCLRKIREHLGRWWPELGPLCFWVTSVSLWDRDPAVGEGQFGTQWPAPMRLLEGPCRAWTTGTRRSEARCPCRCQAPYLASSRYTCLLIHKERQDAVRVLCWLSFWLAPWGGWAQVFPWWAGTCFSVFDCVTQNGPIVGWLITESQNSKRNASPSMHCLLDMSSSFFDQKDLF